MRRNFGFATLSMIAIVVLITISSGRITSASPSSQETATPIGGGSGKIAFVANLGDLYTVNADGSDLQKVMDYSEANLMFAHDPVWTADGKSIIYEAADGFKIINIDERIPQPLRTIPHGGPLEGVISSMGELVFVVPVFGANELYSMSLDGTHLTRLTRGGFHKDPVWLPDGKTLLFAFKNSSYGQPYQLCSINRRGGNFKCYTHTKRINDDTDTDSHFSPDYSLNRIVFVSKKANSPEHQICVIPFEVGSTLHCLTQGNMDLDPVWSPDGTRIAFSSDRDGTDRLYIMNADGSDQHPVPLNNSEEFHFMGAPAWQPAVK